MATTDDTKTADDATSAEDAEPAEDKATKGDDKATQDKASQDDASQDDASQDEVPPDEEPMAPPVDQEPAMRDGGAMNLGVCHFGTNSEEPASILATRSDGTGWIGVCEEHVKDAEKQGFVIEESEKASSSKK